MNTKVKRRIGIVIIFAAVIAATFLLLQWKILDRLQLQLSNLLYQTRQSTTPVVIVGVDQNTSDKMGTNATWTRDKYVQVIKNISKYNPAVIGLDYFFASKSKIIPTAKLDEILTAETTPEEVIAKLHELIGTDINQYDQAFSDEIKNNQKLVLVYPPSDLKEGDLGKSKYQSNFPYPSFMPDQELRIGANQTLQEVDGSVRKYLPVIRGVKDYPSFALALISAYFGVKDMQIISYSPDLFTLNLGGKEIKIPLENYQFLINFTEKNLHGDSLKEANLKNKNFQYISFVDAYNNNFSDLDPSSINGKIVLIGPYVQNNDNYKVPIDNDYRMAGVQIHAEAIQTILDQAWLRNMSGWEIMLAVTILTLFAMVLAFSTRLTVALIGLVLIEFIYSVIFGWLSFKNGLIINLVYPPTAVILTAISSYAFRYMVEFRQKTKVATALGQYVNAGVAESVLESDKTGVEKVGKKEEITVIFTDIRSFTTISEGLQPQSLVALLNEYFEVMAGVVVENGGIVDKYEGDALMAFFEGEEHAVKAARAALGMRVALPKLLEKWRNDPPLPGGEKKPEIDFRVGVSSGEAVVGNIGSSQHIQYTAIGDIVNLGSRLESANKKYQTNVMVSGATFEAIMDQFECRFLDKIKVKGKNKAVDIYELICERGQLSEDEGALISAYNEGLQLYFGRKYAEAAEFFDKKVLAKWPKDYLSNIYAARAQKCLMFPPEADWDFVFKMDSK